MRTICIVSGSTGEYDDRVEWLVDAWDTQAQAEARIAELEKRYTELGGGQIYRRTPAERVEAMAEMHKLDPHFRLDYTGTIWKMCEVELKP